MIDEFESRVSGIPCTVRVLSYANEPATFHHPGFFEFEYTIHDRKGYRAKWLENKITDNDVERLSEEYESRFAKDY